MSSGSSTMTDNIRERRSHELICWIQRIAEQHGVSDEEASPGQQVERVELRPPVTAVVTTGRGLKVDPGRIEAWKRAGIKVPDILPNLAEIWIGSSRVFACEFESDHSRVRVIAFRPGEWDSKVQDWAAQSLPLVRQSNEAEE